MGHDQHQINAGAADSAPPFLATLGALEPHQCERVVEHPACGLEAHPVLAPIHSAFRFVPFEPHGLMLLQNRRYGDHRSSRRIANENPSWGEERIANELLLKLEIRVSARTVNKYLSKRPRGQPRGDLRWSTFLRLHAQGIIACDFFVAVTVTFRLLYAFVVIEHRSRRLIHCNVTAHPSAAWTLQQLREVVGYDERYTFLIHDREGIFSSYLDESIRALGIEVLKSAPHIPKMNAICERVIGTIRRECLDWLIPLSEAHLRLILKSWIAHYNGGRPHMSLGPGIPGAPAVTKVLSNLISRHRRGKSYAVRGASILGGLHHEYSLVPAGG